MATDVTTICNLALNKLGASGIMSLDDASASAGTCKLFYEPTRDEVLRSHRWNFAIKRTELSQLSDAPLFGWAFQYELPTDCLRVLQLNGYEQWERPDMWETEGGMLLTDEDTTHLKYIARVTDTNLFDPLFVDALSSRLAAKIAVKITGSDSKAEALTRDYEVLTGTKAVRANAVERRAKRKLLYVESDLLRARH